MSIVSPIAPSDHTTTAADGQAVRVVKTPRPPIQPEEDLADWVARQADAWRSGGLRERWLAHKLDELAQLVAWTGASTPSDHDDRMQVWDTDIRERHYDRGYADAVRSMRTDDDD